MTLYNKVEGMYSVHGCQIGMNGSIDLVNETIVKAWYNGFDSGDA